VRFEHEDDVMVDDNGTLRRSARIFAPRRDSTSVSVMMGYGFGDEVNPAGRMASDYAVWVHEIDTYVHPEGKSHFLSDPVNEHAGSFESELAADMRESSTLAYPMEANYGETVAEGTDLGAV
jgi:hypothetical protein